MLNVKIVHRTLKWTFRLVDNLFNLLWVYVFCIWMMSMYGAEIALCDINKHNLQLRLSNERTGPNFRMRYI
jgi:hypothetical protein